MTWLMTKTDAGRTARTMTGCPRVLTGRVTDVDWRPLMIDLDELEKLAEAATPGPWTHQPYGPQNQNGDYSGGEVFDGHGEYLFHDVRDEDGEFLVAAQPQVILELIELVRKERERAEAYKTMQRETAKAGREIRAERDAALAALERVRGVLSKWESRQERNREILGSGALGHFQAIDCTGDLRAALDGAPEPEDVWEYGYELIEPDDRSVFEREGDFISAAFAYRAAKKRIHEERHPDVPSLQYAIIRRRKAGPWLPVEGESK